MTSRPRPGQRGDGAPGLPQRPGLPRRVGGGPAASFTVETHADTGAGEPGPVLVWRFPERRRAISSGMLGGGLADSYWIVNVHVRLDYGRLDPGRHIAEIASAAGLSGPGVGLMTAARLEDVATTTDGRPGDEVRCDATVGLSYPTFAAAPDATAPPGEPWRPGTINIVVQLPVPLTDAALVGAVITATEAKTQALADAGVPGTGTASDAIAICCPPAGRSEPVPFAGPRSIWGARMARAVHSAVLQGARRYGARHA